MFSGGIEIDQLKWFKETTEFRSMFETLCNLLKSHLIHLLGRKM